MALVVQTTLPPTVVPELPHHQPPHPDLVDVGLALPLAAVLIAAQRFRFSRTLDASYRAFAETPAPTTPITTKGARDRATSKAHS